MDSSGVDREDLYEAALREANSRHALKTALSCSMAAALAVYFHPSSGQLATVFAYLIMTVGMSSPPGNWLLSQLAIVVSGTVSALILVNLWAAVFLDVAVTLIWIFCCMLLGNRFPLPATLGAMVSALGIFVFFQVGVGGALDFYVAYAQNFLIAGFSVVVVDTLLWQFNTRTVFLEHLAPVYAVLEDHCRYAARRVRSTESVGPPPEAWVPFRPLRQLLAPELQRSRDATNPFARMILACRSLTLRFWFFNRAVAPAVPQEVRDRLANALDRCADQLLTLLDATLRTKQVPSIETESSLGSFVADMQSAERQAPFARSLPEVIVHRCVRSLQSLGSSHNALVGNLSAASTEQLVNTRAFPSGRPLIDANSVRSGIKLVAIIGVLLAEEVGLGFPGGSQVAFFATFFASTGNLGRQNKTDLVGLVGLLGGFAFGVVAAFLTSRSPHLALMLALVFLGQYLASLAYLRWPRYGAAGLQAGLALPFTYLATTGPGWGSFTDATTRFWGLVVAGFSAVVVHAYLWPVLPMRQLRASIAATMIDTAASLRHLFVGPRSAWNGTPASLDDTIARARDLLDDARYLPSAEHADSAYEGVIRCLQEIDANLDYTHLLVSLDAEDPLRQRLFDLIGDYSEQAGLNFEKLAQQFREPPAVAARVEPVRWEPNASGRWENTRRNMHTLPGQTFDPLRPAVIARCLDDIARGVESASAIAHAINLRRVVMNGN